MTPKVCCSADAHLHPTTYGDGHIILKPTVSNIGHATVILWYICNTNSLPYPN